MPRKIESGELKIDDESKEAVWVPLSSAVELPLAESQRRRLKDVYGVPERLADVLKITTMSLGQLRRPSLSIEGPKLQSGCLPHK
jgi:hypothetical protein